MSRLHLETHLVHRVGWLRAAVLGANDGIVSTASLIVGVAAASSGSSEAILAGTAGLVAGAMSMAAGEYVSVSSQSDTEAADLARETRELSEQPEAELAELAAIYRSHGLDEAMALEVARKLTEKDALKVHAREELGITETTQSRPVEAALTSAATFAIGAALPLILVFLLPDAWVEIGVSAGSLVFLALLGGLGAWAGGAGILRPTIRVTFWGALAMAATAAIGWFFGTGPV